MNAIFRPLHNSQDPAIKTARTADIVLKLLLDGKPAVNAELTIEQTKHRFRFGANGSTIIALANNELLGAAKAKAELSAQRLLELFDYITLPFYWSRFEPNQGQPDTDRLLTAAGWFKDKGVELKGHPLCWHTLSPDWLLDLSDQAIMEQLLHRIKRELTDFKGLIDCWDVVNEPVIMPIFSKYDNGITRIADRFGRLGLIRRCFESARAVNPEALLIINDFDYSAPFEIIIEACLEAGIPIDAIGIQSHMHQGWWGVEKTLRILERYERFGIPIHFTETTIISGELMPASIIDLNDYQVKTWPTTPAGEERQAQEVLSHYQTLVARPLVEAITWWDLSDGLWLKAPSGLIRSDFSVKPAYQELQRLIKTDWWAKPTKLRADNEGIIRFNGFLGSYRLTAKGRSANLQISRLGWQEQTVRL